MTIPRVPAVLMALVVASLGVACDNGDDTETAPATSTTTVADDGPAAGEAPECLENGSTEPERIEPTGDLAFITDVRVAATDESPPGCEVVVDFVFEAGTDIEGIGYALEYSDGPFADPSGATTEVDGEAFLHVALLNGTGVDLSEGVRETYTGTPDVPGDLFVVDVQLVSDFEGTSEWVIGVDAERPFLVAQLLPPEPPTLRVSVFEPA